MRILVLGAYGMLGHRLLFRLGEQHDVHGTCRTIRDDPLASSYVAKARLIDGVRADDLASIEDAIRKVRPAVVINCIGIVKQLESSRDPLSAIYVNALFPHRLALICRSAKSRLLHFSTDCVFSGRKGMYRPEDVSDAEDLYGRTKYLGELQNEDCITIRSSVIGRELGSTNGLVEWFLAQRNGSIKGYRGAVYSGFTTDEMSRIVSTVLKHDGLHGVWQVASKPITKYDLLLLMRSEFDLSIKIEPQDEPICDRSLDGSRFNERTGYSPPSWESMIKELCASSDAYESAREGRTL